MMDLHWKSLVEDFYRFLPESRRDNGLGEMVSPKMAEFGWAVAKMRTIWGADSGINNR
jgi:hypothetical protein